MILLANKIDLISGVGEDRLEEHMTKTFLEEFASENGFVGVARVTAKTGENVNIAMSQIVREILLSIYYD